MPAKKKDRVDRAVDIVTGPTVPFEPTSVTTVMGKTTGFTSHVPNPSTIKANGFSQIGLFRPDVKGNPKKFLKLRGQLLDSIDEAAYSLFGDDDEEEKKWDADDEKEYWKEEEEWWKEGSAGDLPPYAKPLKSYQYKPVEYNTAEKARLVKLPAGVSGKLYLRGMLGYRENFLLALEDIARIEPNLIVRLNGLKEVEDKSPKYAEAIKNGSIPWKVLEHAVPDFSAPTG